MLGLLNETADEIGKLLPALLLLPEGGLFDRLIDALEEAQTDGPLTGDEDLLRSACASSRATSTRMDWTDQAAWGRVHRQIEHLNDAGPAASVAAAQSGGKLH